MTNEELQNKLANNLKSAPNEELPMSLFMYIEQKSLARFVRPETELVCTDCLFHDDGEELIAGANRFIFWLVENGLLPTTHRETVQKRIEKICQHKDGNILAVPYVSSFTTKDDDPIQWCEHKFKNDFALKFDTRQILDMIRRRKGCAAYLIPVLYTESDANPKHVVDRLAYLYEHKREAFERYAKDNPSAECDDVVSQILFAAATIRDKQHNKEGEWRLVIFPAPNAPVSLKACVRGICLSPNGDRKKLRDAVLRQIASTGLKTDADFVYGSRLTTENLCATCEDRSTCRYSRKPGLTNGGWNKPSANRPPVKTNQPPVKGAGVKAPPTPKSVVVLVALGALGALCYFLFSGNGDEDAASTKKERGLIKEVTPAAVPKTELEKPLDPNDLKDPRQPWNKDDSIPVPIKGKDGKLYGWVNGVYISPDPAFHEKKKFLDEKNRRENPFRHRSESDIFVLVDSEPGAVIFPMSFDEKFMDDLKQALVEPIKIELDDDPEAARRKQVVIDAKKELKDALKNGADLRQVLEDTYAERQRQNRLFNDLQDGLRELRMKDASDEEIDLYIDASEKMFENHGMTGAMLHIPYKAALRRMKRNQSATPTATQTVTP